MAQIFHPSTNTISKVSIFGLLVFIGGIGFVLYGINSSPYLTQVSESRQQPIQFSHKHHVSGMGIDCRYCHTSVEDSWFAGIPPTETCIGCHAQIWSDSPFLEPVRSSFRTGQSLVWTRVHNLPGFVYFNHSIHIYKGIGCETCHGRVDQMPLMRTITTLQMQWCLDCHRNPEKHVRPRDQVFTMGYKPPMPQEELGPKLMAEYKILRLTDCYTCHR